MSTELSTRRRADAPTDTSINPNARQRQRRSTSSEPARCCSCTRHATCSSATQTRCECRNAGRECVSCCPRSRNRQNRRSEEIARTPLPGMGGLYCLPTSVELPTTPEGTPPIFTADPPESPSTLTQDNLEGGRLPPTPTMLQTRWRRWHYSTHLPRHRRTRGGLAIRPTTMSTTKLVRATSTMP